MATKPQGEDSQQTGDGQQEGSPAVAGWGGKIGAEFQRIKENVEAYPYVWASYIVVYGGFGLWFTYRWRKLRKTEDNVRFLQAKLKRLVEEENAANATANPETTSVVTSEKSTISTVIQEKPINYAAVPKRPTNSSAIPRKPTNTTSLTDTPPANEATK